MSHRAGNKSGSQQGFTLDAFLLDALQIFSVLRWILILAIENTESRITKRMEERSSSTTM